ncbi:hypothetical protein CC78DRAFT_253978 [Lojkania enalia]|uniref:Uncharacterized protein n=1 Tax=Lojkania enalia TaxID=147567 RepID=A0A9P4K978_9PLEO|nr:hypothetical protein CC78DRAFT_253978 [Didymosphaeria enalia]
MSSCCHRSFARHYQFYGILYDVFAQGRRMGIASFLVSPHSSFTSLPAIAHSDLLPSCYQSVLSKPTVRLQTNHLAACLLHPSAFGEGLLIIVSWIAMESPPHFPSNKRHGMHFRNQTPNSYISARFPNPKSDNIALKNISTSTFRTPETIDQALALSPGPLSPPLHQSQNSSLTRQPQSRSRSSSWWMEIRKSPTPKHEPRSRKVNQATIRTDAPDPQPVFESDAFAVHMPTTRIPIIESPPVRVRLPAPSRAQMEAYHAYRQKAQHMRETEYTKEYVPAKVVSYDYAYTNSPITSQPRELNAGLPDIPMLAPAGAFPTSPSVPQHSWTYPRRIVEGPRSISDSSHISIARKPVGLGNIKANDTRPLYQRGDASIGAGATPSLAPKIKIRIKPKTRDPDPVQKESWWSLYNRPSPQSSTNGSRSPSPTKANFACSNHTDTIFDYDTSKPKSPPPERKLTSRWAWLRPASPGVNKPTATQTSTPTMAKATSYLDPFFLHATPSPSHPNTPTASRPASPKKLVRVHSVPPKAESSGGKFDTGLAQIKSFGSLILKLCLLVYALVGLYFLLDAIREAVHALGAPFRAVKWTGGYVWIGGLWLAKVLAKGWERWGVKVALKAGWKGRW